MRKDKRKVNKTEVEDITYLHVLGKRLGTDEKKNK